jgi:hypothetical protein
MARQALGGGIYSELPLTVRGSLIANNSVHAGAALGSSGFAGHAHGGGVAARADANISDSTFEANISVGGRADGVQSIAGNGLGGGLYTAANSTGQVTSSLFHDNESRRPEGGGATGDAAYLAGHTYVVNSTFFDNGTASYGYAVAVIGTANIASSTFATNIRHLSSENAGTTVENSIFVRAEDGKYPGCKRRSRRQRRADPHARVDPAEPSPRCGRPVPLPIRLAYRD